MLCVYIHMLCLDTYAICLHTHAMCLHTHAICLHTHAMCLHTLYKYARTHAPKTYTKEGGTRTSESEGEKEKKRKREREKERKRERAKERKRVPKGAIRLANRERLRVCSMKGMINTLSGTPGSDKACTHLYNTLLYPSLWYSMVSYRII